MDETGVITSRTNALVQRARRVVGGDERDYLALEGDRLVDDAIRARRAIDVILVAHDRSARAHDLARAGQRVQLVDAGILDKISGLDTSPGILAVARVPDTVGLEHLQLDARTLMLVVAGVADPGNLGALARTAEALGASVLVALTGGASPWNAKALRGSMGSLLRLPVATGMSAAGCSTLLARRNVRQVGAVTRGGADPGTFDWRGPLALWITGETGAAPAVDMVLEGVTIPIASDVESLNVTVAASILLYCADRARKSARG